MTSPSLLILGTDAVLAAAPATPVQLAHACLAAGYRAVVPASWGDEIVAARAMQAIEISNGPLVLCACPLVVRRLGGYADDLGSMMLTTVAPPVAAAAYLRALYAPAGVRITFAGACPSGGDAAIDAWLTPAELLADLAGKGIVLADQPAEFDSILPPDRRRHFSDPGGVPAPEALRRVQDTPQLVELDGLDFAIELAQQLLTPGRRLVDAAAALGCVCSGALHGVPAGAARARVRAIEPPRAPTPVVDHDMDLPLQIVRSGERELATPMRPALDADPAPPFVAPARPAPASATAASIQSPDAAGVIAAPAPDLARKRSPGGSSRSVIGALPQARSSGRHLPRAYVARRRSSPKGIRQSGIRRQIDLDPLRDSRRPMLPWVIAVATTLVLVIVLLVSLL